MKELRRLLKIVLRLVRSILGSFLVNRAEQKPKKIITRNNIVKGYCDTEVYNTARGLILVLEVKRNIWNTPKGYGRILVVNLNTDEVVFATEWNAVWNWQQASRQCWLGVDDFIYNSYDSENDRYCSRVVNYISGEAKVFNFPIQTKVNQAEYLSIDFKRLAKCRPDYGYNFHTQTFDLDALSIYLVNVVEEKSKKLISFSSDKLSLPGWRINHVLVKENNMFFLERYQEGAKTIHRAWRGNVETGEIKIVSCISHISHFCFVNDVTIVMTTLRNGVWFIDFVNILTDNILSSYQFVDCHPVFMKNGLIIADSYTDKYGVKRLYRIHYDEKSYTINSVQEIYSSSEPFHLTDVRRCDLHVNRLTESTVLIDESNIRKRYVSTIQV